MSILTQDRGTRVSNKLDSRAIMKESAAVGREGKVPTPTPTARGTPSADNRTRDVAERSLRSLFMIPMSCPSCGRRGNVPLDRLNTRMHCKKCDAVFHLDATGKPTLGEPPPPKGSKAARASKDKNEPLDPIGIVAEKLTKLPTIIWKVLGVALVGFVIYKVAMMYQPKPLTAEQEFSSRIKEAALAFLQKDVAALQGMSADNTREEIAQVVEKYRPLVGDPEGTDPSSMMMLPKIPDEMSDKLSTSVSILPPPAGPGLDSPPTFELYLVWMKANNRYYLDGKDTLKLNEDFLKYNTDRLQKEKAKASGAGGYGSMR